MDYKAIIFDLDGTIIDTEQIWKSAGKRLISSRGITLTPELDHEIHSRLTGCALSESCRIIKELANLPDRVEDLIREKTQYAASMYKQGITFVDGFVDFHKKLAPRNLRTGIATNADDTTLTITKSTLNLENYFGKHIYNISSVNYVGKPNPDLYLLAAEKLEIPPHNCIAIEDSPSGIQAAKAAGMFCIGINTARNTKALAASDLIIEGYKDLSLDELLKNRNE